METLRALCGLGVERHSILGVDFLNAHVVQHSAFSFPLIRNSFKVPLEFGTTVAKIGKKNRHDNYPNTNTHCATLGLNTLYIVAIKGHVNLLQ